MHIKYKKQALRITELEPGSFGVIASYKIIDLDKCDSDVMTNWWYTVECIRCGHVKKVRRNSLVQARSRIKAGKRIGVGCTKCKNIKTEERVKEYTEKRDNKKSEQELVALFLYGRR